MSQYLRRSAIISAVTLAVAACAQTPVAQTAHAAPWNGPIVSALFNTAPATPEASPPPSPPADQGAVGKLAAALRQSVPLAPDNPAETAAALAAARAMMQRTHATVDTQQAMLVVDRSPRVQRLWVVVATPDLPHGAASRWEPLGAVRVSTGKPGRKEHFRTPVGVFQNDGGVLGYRALGTYNENHIRGIGVAGMRVWDFGWQTSDDWRTKGAPMAVRMEMHATDPAVLEPRLGRWDSEGCIRIPSRFNSFLDHTGLIDAKLAAAAKSARRFAALLPKDAVPSPLAGTFLIVVDTSDPAALPSDPVRANAMEHPAVSGPEHDAAG